MTTKPDGWFSRRHKTREAHENARATYQVKVERDPIAEPYGPEMQIERLDARLGKGVGAIKERARLQRRLNGDGEPGTKKRSRKRPSKTTDEQLLDDIFKGQ